MLQNKKVFPFETKEQFQQWVGELLFNLKDTDQETIKLCIYMLGNIVANSPKDPDDNIWPAKYLRETIEAMYAHNLFDRNNREYFEEGVITCKFNSIGLVFIDETDPGKPYADLAEQVRKNIIDICDIYIHAPLSYWKNWQRHISDILYSVRTGMHNCNHLLIFRVGIQK